MTEPKQPVIGVTPDLGETASRPGRPASARLELKRTYLDAVERAGGLPVVLAPSGDAASVAAALDLCAGLVVTGGAFDIPPATYGEAARPGLGRLKPERTEFETALLRAALERRVPVLAVCGGMQLVAVVLGGSLVQDIAREVPGALEHEQKDDPTRPAHSVELDPQSLLARVTGATKLEVNTTHHQAVANVPPGLIVSARAPDGVIEAIEAPGWSFLVGVQWHPELLEAPEHAALYRALVEACR